MALYLFGGVAVFIGSGVMAMAGLGAAFLFVPLFYPQRSTAREAPRGRPWSPPVPVDPT